MFWRNKKLTASDAETGDSFGSSVAVSGDTVAVGAHYDDDAGTNSGSAYLYTLAHSQWTQKKKKSKASIGFGLSLDIDQDALAVGASQDGTNGAAYIFYRNLTGQDT